MKRSDIIEFLECNFIDIINKFTEKNESYGSEKHSAFYNFEETGKRICSNLHVDLEGLDIKLLPLFVYMDKHHVALMQGLSKTPEFKERVIDNIVYSFLALAMYEQEEKTVCGGVENV